jgi:hypothetical protein
MEVKVMTLDDLRQRWQRMIPPETQIDVDDRCLPLLDQFFGSVTDLRDVAFRVSGPITTEEGEVIVGYSCDPEALYGASHRFIHLQMSLLAARSYFAVLPPGQPPRQVIGIIDDMLHEYDPVKDAFFPSVWKGTGNAV